MAIAYNTSVVRNGLVLHLDAANVKSYPGTGTAWNDLSGTGNNGTLVNSPTYNSANLGSIVFDGVDDYVNGVYVANTTGSPVSSGASTNNLRIASGSSPASSYSFLSDCNVSNIKMYNRALSANEILQNFNSLKGRYQS